MTGDSPTDEEAKERLELARETFHEILDSTKHHDDKIGRFITGISFLTAGAIAFGFRSEILAIRYEFGSSAVPLPALCFTAFLLLVLLGVLLLIVALGPNIELPTGPESRAQHESRLYFLFIARETPDGWKARWENECIKKLRSDLTRDYLRESWQLAEKTDFKHLRTSEARAVLSLAVLSLALGLVLAINGWTNVEVAADNLDLTDIGSVAWSRGTRFAAALVIAGFVLVLGYEMYRLEQSVLTTLGGWRKRQLRRLVAAIVLLALFPFVMLAAAGLLWPRGVALAVALVAWLLWDRYESKLAQWVLTLLVALLALAVLATVFSTSQMWDLALASGAAVIIAAPRLLASVETWHERRREAMKVTTVLDGHLATDQRRDLQRKSGRGLRDPGLKPSLELAISQFERANDLKAGSIANLLKGARTVPAGEGTGPDIERKDGTK